MSATAPDFVRAGLTYRQVDWWATKGYLLPEGDANPGNGHSRRFPYSELRVAKLMIRLTDASLTVEAAARIARDREGGPAELRRLADLVEAAA